MSPAIAVERLSKSYLLRHEPRERYVALRDVLARGARSLWSRGAGRTDTGEEFWALNDISFMVQSGERIGIIGGNGAGKSTLLKILSRITYPTTGRIEIAGRVASLLEVGTGFHPELTGRENIFLNGAVLGMNREEIRRKFDDIVSFAEIERFLDTPVKRYSSGMYLRLAFSVAAHLEPDILIVDEILAVGDARFQRRCLNKMESVGKEGRTVLFVSHNMGLIASLCTKALLLERGRLAAEGSPSEVILRYYSSDHSSPAVNDFARRGTSPGGDYAKLHRAYVRNARGGHPHEFDISEPIIAGMNFEIVCRRQTSNYRPYTACYVYDGDGACVFYTSLPNAQCEDWSPGHYRAEVTIPAGLLNSGTYFVSYGFADCDTGLTIHFFERNAVSFQIREDMELTLGESHNGYTGVIPGPLRPRLEWTVGQG